MSSINPDSLMNSSLAGLPVTAVMTHAPGNNAPMGGVKVVLGDESWFAIRPSGTEPKMKVYVESFGGEGLWNQIYDGALSLIFG